MKYKINRVSDLGDILRATRKTHSIRQDDLAGMAGVGTVFASHVENGKESAQIGLILKLAHELGLHIYVDTPCDISEELLKIQSKGSKQ